MSVFTRASIVRFSRLGRVAVYTPAAAVAVMATVALLRAAWPVGMGGTAWALLPALAMAPLAAGAGVAAHFSGPRAGALCETLADVPAVLLAAPALALELVAPGWTLALAALVYVAPRAFVAARGVAPEALEAGLALGLPLGTALGRVWLPLVGPALVVAMLRGLSRTVGVAAPLVALGHAGLLPAAVALGGDAGQQAGAAFAILAAAVTLEAAAQAVQVRS